MPQRYGSDDIDDILSTIMQKKDHKPHTPAQPVNSPAASHHTPNSQASNSPTDNRTVKKPVLPPRKSFEAPVKKPKKYRYKKKLLAVPVAIILIVAVALLARPIMAFIMPSAPFPKELVEKTSYPLLYPGQLPAGYAIDEATISQSADSATVYAIKNKDGNPINISLQQQPNGLNLQPIYDTMTDVKSIDIPAGTTTIGVSKDDMITAHTLTGEIWIITRTPVDGGLQASDIENMLKTLKAAE